MICHAVFEVPDDEIVDNRIECSVNYLSVGADGKLEARTQHGDISNYSKELIEACKIATLSVNTDDVVIFKFPNGCTADEVSDVRSILNAEFPNNKVIGVCDDLDVLSQSPKEAINMLEKMIAHIKIVNI